MCVHLCKREREDAFAWSVYDRMRKENVPK